MKYNFDELTERRGSNSVKWDEDTTYPDILPMWVADMDFPTAPAIVDALRRRVEHGVFGYTLIDHRYYQALTGWFDTRHGYAIAPALVIYTSGVVPAVSAIIKALCVPGDGVIVQTPVYNCFFSSIRNNGCRIVDNPLIRIDRNDGTFSYEMDFGHLESVAAQPDVTMMLLCNPHNPAGRAWRRDELLKVADICRRHGVTVVSDEIHCELTLPGFRYVPYGTVDNSALVCLSPSQAFNTAGLQIANIVCPDQTSRSLIDRAINVNEVCDVNPFGVEALKAAYSPEGAAWLDALRTYLNDNYLFLRDTLARKLPQCPVCRLEATYLPWIDISAFAITSRQLEENLKSEAKVWVNCGEMYGTDGYIRVNIACPRHTLAEGLKRITGYLCSL